MAIEKDTAKRLFRSIDHMRNPVKNATNPFLKNKYADLGEVIDCVKSALNENGLFVVQSCELICDSKALRVFTKIVDAETGTEAIATTVDVLLKQFDPQGSMSAFTYGRRYALLAAFNFAAEDDDANVASGKNDEQALNRAAVAIPATSAVKDAVQALKTNVALQTKLK